MTIEVDDVDSLEFTTKLGLRMLIGMAIAVWGGGLLGGYAMAYNNIFLMAIALVLFAGGMLLNIKLN